MNKKVIPIELERMFEKKALHAISDVRLDTLGSNEHNSLQHLGTLGLELDLTTTPCNRARLNTGTFCNYDCEFCYYKDMLDVKTPWEIVKGRIDHLLSYGITQVDMSGGESSVSPDWFTILDYCNDKFEHISCLSHGGKFANMDFLKESQAHGLKEILFSLHGATAEVHDTITGRKGSFDRILKGIANAKELGMIVRTNTTVYYRNYHQLENEHADLINSIKPVESNFITLNYWGDFNVIEFENVGYKEITDAVKKCIDKIQDGIEINVRYAPYCYMEGYEKYVAGTYQHIYDVRDWNREMYTYLLDVSKEYTPTEKIQNAYEECATHRSRFYKKDKDCVKCKHFYICDGIEKEIADTTPVIPATGDKIKQVNFYRKNRDVR
jgi:MoaA/NifB/PqqE/SkfB family radical SAM enzyme